MKSTISDDTEVSDDSASDRTGENTKERTNEHSFSSRPNGIKQFYEDHLSQTHNSVIPSEIFSQGHSIGLRDVGLKIVQQIQKGQKVVVLDGNEVRKTRESYIKLLKKKCSKCTVEVINIFPKYGCQQLLWSREHDLAATAEHSDKQLTVTDSRILKWFERESDTEITYKLGKVDIVNESEGCSVQTVTLGLSARSTYKWEVPGLFIQWEIIHGRMERGEELCPLVEVMKNWADRNPCGRIIVICDGNKIGTGEHTKNQETSDIKTALNSMCEKLDDNIVYVIHIEDPDQAGMFVQPPRPGILAYLQCRHNLNLHSKNTCYLYETSSHLKMAEHAGVRHIKGSKVIKNPNLVKSQTCTVVPPIPEMLQTLELLLPVVEQDHYIPFYSMKQEFQDGCVSNDVGRGRTEYLFAKDWRIVEEQQDLYQKMATKVGQAGSKMSPVKSDQSGGFTPLMSDLNQSKTSTVSRDLPRWMLGKEGSGSKSKSLRSSNELSGDVETNDQSKRQTVYMLTDHELVETAIEILKQAGKTDLINSFQSKQDKSSSVKGDNDCKRQKISQKSQNKPVAGMKRKYNEKGDQNFVNEESLSSLCPKMEPDSDISGDEPLEIGNDSHNLRKQGRKTDGVRRTRSAHYRQNESGAYHNMAAFQGKPRNCSLNQAAVTRFSLKSDDIMQSESGKNKGHDMDCSDCSDNSGESEDSVECRSTETSQGGDDSLDLDSDIDGFINDKTADRKDSKLAISEIDKGGLSVSERQDVLASDTSCKHKTWRSFNKSDANLTAETPHNSGHDSKPAVKNKSVMLSGSSGRQQRPQRAPDLSILDEIFD